MLKHLMSIVGNLRSALNYAVVQNVDDTGGAQMLTVKTGDGVQRAQVEVMQPFGFGSVPPADGAVTVVMELGADPGNLVAFSVANPSTRFGKLAPGEAVLYAADGSRVHIRQGGVMEVWCKQLVANVTTAVVSATDGVTINGNVAINGNLTATGDVSDGHGSLDRLRGHYDAHEHTNNGASPPTVPDPE